MTPARRTLLVTMMGMARALEVKNVRFALWVNSPDGCRETRLRAPVVLLWRYSFSFIYLHYFWVSYR